MQSNMVESKSDVDTKGNHCHCKNDDGLYLPHGFRKSPFTPTDYEELMDPQNHVESVVLNENNVFAYLESLGYDSSKLVKRNDN